MPIPFYPPNVAPHGPALLPGMISRGWRGPAPLVQHGMQRADAEAFAGPRVRSLFIARPD